MSLGHLDLEQVESVICHIFDRLSLPLDQQLQGAMHEEARQM